MRSRPSFVLGRTVPLRATCMALGLPLLLAGCAQLPDWQGKASLDRPLPTDLSASAHAPTLPWPQAQWWQRYGDAQLNALIDEALQGAPDMAAAAARVRQAQALLGVQQSSTRPQLSANASVSGEKFSHNYLTPSAMTPDGLNDTGRATLNLHWSLDLWGQQRAAIAAAAGELQARQADAAQARLLLSSNVALAYADLLRLGANARTLAQSVQVRTTTVTLFQERFDHGLENQGSVHGAQARLAAARAELAQAQELVALQRHRIAALVGATPERGDAITVPDSALAQPWQQQWGLPAQLPAHLLGRRPDVVAARLQAQALESRAAAKEAAFYPDVNLSALVGVQALGLDMLTHGGSSIASVGPAITLPIFNGGRLRAELGAARAGYDEAVAHYHATLNRALQEVADNAASQRALGQQLSALQQAVQSATEAHRVARNRYEGGLANHLEVLNAEDLLLANVRQLVQVQTRALALDIELHRALGGGWQADDPAPAPQA